MEKTKLSLPWQEYVKRLQCLFEFDDEIDGVCFFTENGMD